MNGRRTVLLAFAALALCVSVVRAADPIDYDADGRINAVIDWPREAPLKAGTWIVGPGWQNIVRQELLSDVKYTPGAKGEFTREGHGLINGGRIDLGQSANGRQTTYRLLAPDNDVSIEGVYWLANVPIDAFKGGSAKIAGKTIALEPAKSPETRALGEATADHVTLRSADGRTTIEIAFDREVHVRVQDVSSYGEQSFQIYAAIVEGRLPRGVPSGLTVTIKPAIAPDTSEATITIDPAGPRSRFEGFGGNFIYGADSPVTRATLDALRLTWARIPLELRDWEPINDNVDATNTDMTSLAANDSPTSPLRRRLELDRDLFKRSEGRLIASVWYLPEWLFAEPVDTRWRERAGVAPRERWPELAECIVSYLQHAKEKYGIEPQLFSFNESDLGVYVKLDGEEMRDLAKLLRTRFANAGLKTKLLLGDSADLNAGFEQIGPTLADDEVRTFVGALGYHPWSGQNEFWPQWATLAEKHKLPLLVTEMGADPFAWRNGSFASPVYALRLARRYLEQLSTGRAQSLLEWEWSDDFAMTAKGADGRPALSPRGQWLAQITQRTPQFAESIATRCDRPTVRAATIARGDTWAVHIVNLDADRILHLRGLPATVKSMTLSMVDPETGAEPDQQVEVTHGDCTLKLPAAAMATLSTTADR